MKRRKILRLRSWVGMPNVKVHCPRPDRTDIVPYTNDHKTIAVITGECISLCCTEIWITDNRSIHFGEIHLTYSEVIALISLLKKQKRQYEDRQAE